MEIENSKYTRQGDLLLVRLDKIPEYVRGRENSRVKDGILARGEATGHHHRIETLVAAEVYRVNDWRNGAEVYLEVGEVGVRIVHEEHAPVTLAPGAYRVHRAREYDYLSDVVRTVRD